MSAQATARGRSIKRVDVMAVSPRFRWRTQMDEQRKYAVLFAATILAARKFHEIGDKPCPARECAISDAITKAEQILRKIDERWPTKVSP